MKGIMFADWRITCGKCNREECLDTFNKPVANQRRDQRGWKQKKAYGWVCPECMKEIESKGK